MAFPPSASLEGPSFPDGLKQLSSAASDTPTPGPLQLLSLALLVVNCTISILDNGIPAIVVESGAALYRTLVKFVDLLTFYHTILTRHIHSKLLRVRSTITAYTTSIYNSFLDRPNASYNPVYGSSLLHIWLDYQLSNRTTDANRTIIVNAITSPDSKTLTLIRGLPSNVSAPEIRRFLETALYDHFHSKLQAQRAPICPLIRQAIAPENNDTGSAAIIAPSLDLRRGGCLCFGTSGVNIPAPRSRRA